MESTSGGVILVDYDSDGYSDIYFTNAQASGKLARRCESRALPAGLRLAIFSSLATSTWSWKAWRANR